MPNCYITLESAVSFKWISEQLTNLVFHGCLESALVCGDFSKGLGVAIAAKVVANQAGCEATKEVLPCWIDDSSMLEAEEVLVANKKAIPIRLQLCKWHAVEAIIQRLVLASRYPKQRRNEIVDMI
jgi:hypothetical protein